jgi:hypothetical protein
LVYPQVPAVNPFQKSTKYGKELGFSLAHKENECSTIWVSKKNCRKIPFLALPAWGLGLSAWQRRSPNSMASPPAESSPSPTHSASSSSLLSLSGSVDMGRRENKTEKEEERKKKKKQKQKQKKRSGTLE